MEIADIKQSLTLAQVLQHYGLKPDKSLRLHCPFHEDKTPSMQVYYKTHTAYCFSGNCKTHGKAIDVIDFIMHKESCTKHEAIQKAETMVHGAGDKEQGVKTNAEQMSSACSVERSAFLESIFTTFTKGLYSSVAGRDYLQQRNLDLRQLTIGYNSGQFHHGPRKTPELISECLQYGLLIDNNLSRGTGDKAYSIFGKNCVCFALRNQSNNITGLYFRSTIDNTQNKHFYLKNRSGLYPCYPNDQTTHLILTEAIIDAATLLQQKNIADSYSILACYGTNGLTQEHINAIKQLPQLQEITFFFDGDQAGRTAQNKYAAMFTELLPQTAISYVPTPDGEDINSLLQGHEPSILSYLIDQKQNFTSSTEQQTTAATPTDTTTATIATTTTLQRNQTGQLCYQKQHIQIQLLCDPDIQSANSLRVGLLIKKRPHIYAKEIFRQGTIDLYHYDGLQKTTKKTAEQLGLSHDYVSDAFAELIEQLEQYIQQQKQQQTTTANNIPDKLTAEQTKQMQAFAKKPGLIKRLNELLGKTGIIGEERNRIFLLLIAASHKMPETLHALIQGSSGSGKTRLLKQISDCMPQESVTKLTRLSDKVLYNFPERYFVNRLLCLEDIDGLSEEAEFAFRELQSNGELNSAISIKLDNGQITSGQKTVRGPIASLACTTRGEIYEDNMSRVFLIAVDESAGQTKRIIQYQNSVAAGMISREDEENTKELIRNYISILQPCKVINPYANQIQLPQEAHKIRRLNDLFQSFIKMVTILNQYQRQKDDRQRLITQTEDIQTAIHIMFESILLKVDELDGSLRQFYEQLKTYLQKLHGEKYQTSEFSLREIRQTLKLSKTQLFRYINDLTNLEYIRQSGGHHNKGYTYKICYWDNYEAMRDKIKQHLQEQLKQLQPKELK